MADNTIDLIEDYEESTQSNNRKRNANHLDLTSDHQVLPIKTGRQSKYSLERLNQRLGSSFTSPSKQNSGPTVNSPVQPSNTINNNHNTVSHNSTNHNTVSHNSTNHNSTNHSSINHNTTTAHSPKLSATPSAILDLGPIPQSKTEVFRNYLLKIQALQAYKPQVDSSSSSASSAPQYATTPTATATTTPTSPYHIITPATTTTTTASATTPTSTNTSQPMINNPTYMRVTSIYPTNTTNGQSPQTQPHHAYTPPTPTQIVNPTYLAALAPSPVYPTAASTTTTASPVVLSPKTAPTSNHAPQHLTSPILMPTTSPTTTTTTRPTATTTQQATSTLVQSKVATAPATTNTTTTATTTTTTTKSRDQYLMEALVDSMITRTEKELSLLKAGLFCPLCKKYLTTIFFQCGHSACERCATIAKKCHSCFKDITTANKLNYYEKFPGIQKFLK